MEKEYIERLDVVCDNHPVYFYLQSISTANFRWSDGGSIIVVVPSGVTRLRRDDRRRIDSPPII
jgi:hypothetical protein